MPISADAVFSAFVGAACVAIPGGLTLAAMWGKIRSEVDEVKASRIADMASFTKAQEKMELKVESLDRDSSSLKTEVAVLSNKFDTLTKSVSEGFDKVERGFDRIFGELTRHKDDKR